MLPLQPRDSSDSALGSSRDIEDQSSSPSFVQPPDSSRSCSVFSEHSSSSDSNNNDEENIMNKDIESIIMNEDDEDSNYIILSENNNNDIIIDLDDVFEASPEDKAHISSSFGSAYSSTNDSYVSSFDAFGNNNNNNSDTSSSSSSDNDSSGSLKKIVAAVPNNNNNVTSEPPQGGNPTNKFINRPITTASQLAMLEYLHTNYYQPNMESRHVTRLAKQNLDRHLLWATISTIITLQTAAVLILKFQYNFTILQACLYAASTITTVGYNIDTKNNDSFYIFASIYALVAVSLLILLLIQAYHAIINAFSLARFQTLKNANATHGLDQLASILYHPPLGSTEADDLIRRELHKQLRRFNRRFRKQRHGLKFTRNGTYTVMACAIMLLLILLGAIVNYMLQKQLSFRDAILSTILVLTTTSLECEKDSTAAMWFNFVYMHASVVFMVIYVGVIICYCKMAYKMNTQRIERKLVAAQPKRKQHQQQQHLITPTSSNDITAAVSSEDGGFCIESQQQQQQHDDIPPPHVFDFENHDNDIAEIDSEDSSEISNNNILPPLPQQYDSDGGVYMLRSPPDRPRKFIRELSNLSLDDPVVISSLPTMKHLINHIHECLREGAFLDSSLQQTLAGSMYCCSPQVVRKTQVRQVSMNEITNRRKTVPKGPPLVATLAKYMENPTLALRVLVQERVAEIIAIDLRALTGDESCISFSQMLKNQPNVVDSVNKGRNSKKKSSSSRCRRHTNSTPKTRFYPDNSSTGKIYELQLDSLKILAKKWLIPKCARIAFYRAVFEVLIYIGTNDLRAQGADALYNLNPQEFDVIFTPIIVAMKDMTTMDQWMKSTDSLLSTQKAWLSHCRKQKGSDTEQLYLLTPK